MLDLELKPSVEKDFRSIPQASFDRIWKRLTDLRGSPHPRDAVKLAGSEALFRVRVGDYRIVYSIDRPRSTIVVHYVRHRREVYRGL